MAIQQKKRGGRQFRPRRSSEPCFFCVGKVEPDYKEVGTLKKFLSSKGRVVGRMFTGVCQKHQRRVARQIKRARHLALMPFV